jgi:hypothetical protein
MALGRLAAGSDPKASALFNSLQLSGSGKSIQLSFTVPAELIDMALPPIPPAPPAPAAPPQPQG